MPDPEDQPAPALPLEDTAQQAVVALDRILEVNSDPLTRQAVAEAKERIGELLRAALAGMPPRT